MPPSLKAWFEAIPEASEPLPCIPETPDRDVLVRFYNTTGGPDWDRNRNWLSNRSLNTWYGIVTDEEGYVTEVSLVENNIAGPIPPEFGSLTRLEVLEMYYNHLSGEIPPELGNLSNLVHLGLYENELEGAIPPELGNLPRLRDFHLSENQLTGTIPAALGNLPVVVDFGVQNNNLTGPIPPEFGGLTSLVLLSLYNNNLSGPIPPEIGNLSNLELFDAGENQFDGPLPPEFSKLAKLERLLLDESGLNGPIPPELGNLKKLKDIWLYRNQLEGPIPPELGGLDSLVTMVLHTNQLDGPLPPELGKLSKLEFLWLDANKITGPIPPELGNLKALKRLRLSRNQLSGPIPPELGNLTSLKWLILSKNRLSGSIPPELGQMSSLVQLALYNNQFWVFWKTGADVRRGRGWKRQHCRYDIGGSQGVLYLEVIPKGVSMRIETLVKETLDLQGFRVGRVDGGTDEIVVRIVADGRYAPRCGECGEKAKYRDERRERRYRHVPLWGIPVTLVYTLRRVRCKRCGLRVEAVPWAEGKQRFTRAMSVTMAEWAKLLPWSHVARMFGCSWSTVQQAVKAVVAYGRERQELDGLTHIGVDEIARKRGHVYMTVVYDLKKSRLVWVGDGRTRETLERFFDFLGEDRSKRLEAVCCDMWRSYVNAVRARAPQALIVFDKFHIVSHLGKAVDEVRREEIREKGQAHKDLVKNSRYLWLKNPWNLTGGQAERLATLVKLNTEVHRAYLLKEMFRRFWEYKRPGWAKRFLKLWCAWAVGTGLSPLRKFARTMLRHMDDILNYFRARITNGAVEGMNNKAKVVMRRAYGLRTAESCATNLYHCLASLPMPELSHRFA